MSLSLCQGWTDLLDFLIGSLLAVLSRISGIHQVISRSIEQSVDPSGLVRTNSNCDSDTNNMVNGVDVVNGECSDDLDMSRDSDSSWAGGPGLDRLSVSAREVVINICDQVIETWCLIGRV